MIKSVMIKNYGNIGNLKFECSKFNIFFGPSLQGKSTIIDSIKWAIIGGNDDYYIKNGEEECEVILETDTGLRVERRKIRGGKSRLYLFKNDKAIEDGQKILNKTYNEFLFSPISLLSLKPKEQAEFINSMLSKRLELNDIQLKEWQLSHLDKEALKEDPIKAIEKEYQKNYDERTEANKALKNVEAAVNGNMKMDKIPTDDEIIITETKLESLNQELKKGQQNNSRADAAKKNQAAMKSIQSTVENLQKEIDLVEIDTNINIDELDKQIQEFESQNSKNQSELIEKKALFKSKQDTLEKIKDGQPKCPISDKIACTTDMKPYKEKLEKEVEELKTEIKKKMADATEFNEKLQDLKSKKEITKNIENKKVELNRAKSMLESLDITNLEVIDLKELENKIDETSKQLMRMKISLELSKKSGIESLRKRQSDLDQRVKFLRDLLDNKIPVMLKINIPNVQITKEGLFFRGLPLHREGSSAQLKICTAILKDINKKANIYTLDKLEGLDQHTLKKYIDGCSSANDDIQYFGTYVGKLDFSLHENAKAFEVKSFNLV